MTLIESRSRSSCDVIELQFYLLKISRKRQNWTTKQRYSFYASVSFSVLFFFLQNDCWEWEMELSKIDVSQYVYRRPDIIVTSMWRPWSSSVSCMVVYGDGAHFDICSQYLKPPFCCKGQPGINTCDLTRLKWHWGECMFVCHSETDSSISPLTPKTIGLPGSQNRSQSKCNEFAPVEALLTPSDVVYTEDGGNLFYTDSAVVTSSIPSTMSKWGMCT